MSDNVLTTGVKGTDNCPVCGRTMKRKSFTLCGIEYWMLVCVADGHRAQIILPREKG